MQVKRNINDERHIFDLLNMLNIFKVYLPRFLHWPVVVDQALQKPDLQKSQNLNHIVLNTNEKVEEQKKPKKTKKNQKKKKVQYVGSITSVISSYILHLL